MRAEVHSRRVGGVLIVEVVGLFNQRAAAKVRKVLDAELADRPAVKALLDLRLAAILVDLRDVASDLAVEVALGILADPAYESNCWNYCLSVILAGRTRVPFTDWVHAQHWAEAGCLLLRPTKAFEPANSAGSR
jgi:hypothetical protein